MGKLKKAPMTRRDAADAVRLQKAGQKGDTILAHINPQEAALLDLLADGLLDAPRNPKTGLLSFGMSDAEGPSGQDSNPGGVGGGPAGGNTGGGIGGNTDDGTGGRSGGYGDNGYSGSKNEKAAKAIGDYYRDNYINGLLDTPYAPKDTWTRVWQEYWTPSVRAPGRFSPPTAAGPGIMGSFVSHLAGGPFGQAMNVGGAMGRASSPATQAASAAEDAARSSHNSGGNQGSHSVQAADAKIAELLGSAPGGRSGANTAPAAAVPPGFTLNPAGQLIPLPQTQGKNRAAWRDPVRNMIMDYIWRGPTGRGMGIW